MGELTKSSLYQLLQFDYRQLMHRRQDRIVNATRAKVREEKKRRHAKVKAVWARWWNAASAQERGGVRDRMKAASAKRLAMVHANAMGRQRIREHVLECHGVIDSYVRQTSRE
eukprot:8010628-Pyramimonas_sp.AAC.1